MTAQREVFQGANWVAPAVPFDMAIGFPQSVEHIAEVCAVATAQASLHALGRRPARGNSCGLARGGKLEAGIDSGAYRGRL